MEIGLFSVCPMKPDAKRPRELQRGQRAPVISIDLMHSLVPDLAERMKHVRSFLRNDALVREPAKRRFERLTPFEVKRMMRRDALAQQFRELPWLDNRRRRIVSEITLRERPQLLEPGIVRSQKAEVACSQKCPQLPVLTFHLLAIVGGCATSRGTRAVAAVYVNHAWARSRRPLRVGRPSPSEGVRKGGDRAMALIGEIRCEISMVAVAEETSRRARRPSRWQMPWAQ